MKKGDELIDATGRSWLVGDQVWPPVHFGAWPDNPTFPVSWDERDAKGV